MLPVLRYVGCVKEKRRVGTLNEVCGRHLANTQSKMACYRFIYLNISGLVTQHNVDHNNNIAESNQLLKMPHQQDEIHDDNNGDDRSYKKQNMIVNSTVAYGY